jgi:hypothetical protein
VALGAAELAAWSGALKIGFAFSFGKKPNRIF